MRFGLEIEMPGLAHAPDLHILLRTAANRHGFVRQIRDAGLRMGFKSVLVCSHVNGWMGYILDAADYERGGYEATLSLYGREEGSKVVQSGINALRALRAKP